MNKIYLLWTCCLTLLFMAGCEKEGVKIDTGYISWPGYKIVWQADASIKYNMVAITSEGDTISPGYLPSSYEGKTVKIYAYKNDETTPELESDFVIENGKSLDLIQMPGAPISKTEPMPDNDPDLPADQPNKFKVRLFYNNVDGWGDEVKLDLYYKPSTTVPMRDAYNMNISLELKNGVLSDYIAVDLNELSPVGGNNIPVILAVITDKSGNVLLDARKDLIPFKGQIVFASSVPPIFANGSWSYGIKYVTSGFGSNRFDYLFGEERK